VKNLKERVDDIEGIEKGELPQGEQKANYQTLEELKKGKGW
jgi:hypothetical protein